MFGTIKQIFDLNVMYWFGPYNIRVPKSINTIVAKDGFNTMTQDGCETEMGVIQPISEQEYKQKYAVLIDGYYYYKDPQPQHIHLTKSSNQQIKNDDIAQQFLHVFLHGRYYNPANKHYGNVGIVR